jgi:hypothetical protein
LYLCINIQLWYLIHDIHGLRVWIAAFGLSLNLGLLRLIFAVFAVLEPHTVYSADMEATARATELESLREIEHKPDDERGRGIDPLMITSFFGGGGRGNGVHDLRIDHLLRQFAEFDGGKSTWALHNPLGGQS